ncbi:MAG: ATP-dependent zinc metalloprotease FtsH [Mycobacteriales bacterium]
MSVHRARPSQPGQPTRLATASAKSGPPPDRPVPPAPPPPPPWRQWLLPLGLLLSALILFGPSLSGGASRQQLNWTEFLAQVNASQVKAVTVDPKGDITGTLTNGTQFSTMVPTALGDTTIDQQLEAHHVAVTAVGTSSSILSVLLGLLPLLLFIGIFIYLGRATRRQLAGISGIGRSRARVFDAERPTTRFGDVAGYEGAKQEVSEVVDFLKSPDRYRRAGATGPRGVLMVGPPGTGKTLLARAVAGEAEVPFLSVTGSSFVEMFVGVGASRVRDLFAEARKRGPSIIFIDEVDAIGQRRGSGIISNDEREQTLNQLLAEMDGFDEGHDVVVLAATNRPETLDPALLRPGRFDRQVTVPLPAQKEREAILGVHSRGKSLAADVDLDVVARGTPGFSGADLANLVNEAAIVAVRAGREIVCAADFEEARDRLLLGRRDASNVLLPEEKYAVAVHESGHALVAALCEHADPVAKVTILPAGMALGVTELLPVSERHLYTEGYLTDLLTVRLGGRAAELAVLGQGSTGAANDLASATDIATKMVREYGLSPALGPVGYSTGSPMFLGSEEIQRRVYSETTQRIVDSEVSRLLREAADRALALLTENRGALDRLTATLLEQETVDGSVVTQALAAATPTAVVPAG